MHPKSPANRLSGTHGAKILPGRTPFRCTDPSNHARRANVAIRRPAPNRPSARNPGAAEQREPPELDRTTQETQPGGSAPVASWAASTASSSRGAATALCQHQPVACRPGEQLRHCRQRLLWRQHPRRHRPADPPSCARPKEGYFPYLWRLSSVLLADAIGL